MQRYKGHSCFPTTDGTGSYVLHSDAAALIAAKDAEIERLEGDLLTFNNIGYELRVRAEKAERERDDALEALRVRLSESIDSSKTPESTRRLALAVAEVKAWKVRYSSECPADAGTLAHTAYYTAAANALAEARAATDADPVLRAMIGGGE